MHPRPDNPEYFALTGDMVGSREVPDRASVQRELRDTLAALNRTSGPALATPLKLVAGDEVQGLFHDPAGVVDVVAGIADALHPVAVVWGLGRGSISTDWAEDVSLMDGPCLHRAREAVEVAAAEARWLVARGIEPPHGETLSTLFHLTWTLRSGWTETQIRYIRDARHHNQTEVAALHDVSKQAVSKALDSARFAAVLDGEEAARRLLGWLGPRSSPGSSGDPRPPGADDDPWTPSRS